MTFTHIHVTCQLYLAIYNMTHMHQNVYNTSWGNCAKLRESTAAYAPTSVLTTYRIGIPSYNIDISGIPSGRKSWKTVVFLPMAITWWNEIFNNSDQIPWFLLYAKGFPAESDFGMTSAIAVSSQFLKLLSLESSRYLEPTTWSRSIDSTSIPQDFYTRIRWRSFFGPMAICLTTFSEVCEFKANLMSFPVSSAMAVIVTCSQLTIFQGLLGLYGLIWA